MVASTPCGAPIQKYSDPRLYGTRLVKPFQDIRASWIAPLTNPIHPDSNKVIEVGRRSCNALAGAVVTVAFCILPILGRIIQVIHFHTLSKESREQPVPISFQGLQIPALQFKPIELPYMSFRQRQIEAIQEHDRGLYQPIDNENDPLRGSYQPIDENNPQPREIPLSELEMFPPGQSAEAAQAALRGGKFSTEDQGNQAKNCNIIALAAEDVRLSEVAYLSGNYQELMTNLLAQWKNKPSDDCTFEDSRFQDVVLKLFQQNGFRAYSCLDRIVFDNDCIEIVKVHVLV